MDTLRFHIAHYSLNNRTLASRRTFFTTLRIHIGWHYPNDKNHRETKPDAEQRGGQWNGCVFTLRIH